MGAQPEWHQVQVLSRVRLVQNMSRKCPTSAFANTLIAPLDILWTRAGFSCPIFVQRPLTWTGSLHQLDSDWTDPVLFLPLDRPWTECGQTLDKSWILCPGSVQPLSNHPLLTRTQIRDAIRHQHLHTNNTTRSCIVDKVKIVIDSLLDLQSIGLQQ